jgi:hypothetical protein
MWIQVYCGIQLSGRFSVLAGLILDENLGCMISLSDGQQHVPQEIIQPHPLAMF